MAENKGCWNCRHHYVNHKACNSDTPCKSGSQWKTDKVMYDLELLRDVGPFKKGERVRGACATTSDFSKFKRWFLDRHESDTIGNTWSMKGVRALYNETFKVVEV